MAASSVVALVLKDSHTSRFLCSLPLTRLIHLTASLCLEIRAQLPLCCPSPPSSVCASCRAVSLDCLTRALPLSQARLSGSRYAWQTKKTKVDRAARLPSDPVRWRLGPSLLVGEPVARSPRDPGGGSVYLVRWGSLSFTSSFQGPSA